MAEVRILYIATALGLVQLANPGKSDRWREIGRALEQQDVRAVAASPADPLLAFAAGSAGIERSTNGGAGWERVEARGVTALAFSGERIVACTEQRELLTTMDGQRWSTVGEAGSPIVRFLAQSGSRLVTVGADGMVGELDGDTWRPLNVGTSGVRGVAADHQTPGTLFVAGTSTLITPHGTTQLAEPPTGAMLNLPGSPPALLLGTSGQLLRSEDGGVSLALVDGPREVTALVSPQRAVDQVFAGTSTGELWYSADRGRGWTSVASGYAAIHNLAFARAL